MYYGAQYLLKTSDGAVNWEVISPDLTSSALHTAEGEEAIWRRARGLITVPNQPIEYTQIRMQRIGRDVAAFKATGGKPITVGNFAVVAAIWHHNRPAILLRRVSVIRKRVCLSSRDKAARSAD